MLGRVIGEKYRIEAEIGSGGMATVYRATRLRIGDAVAIKVLHPELLREPKFAERFEREAQAAARLKHPNVAAIYDFGEDGELLYLVMELVEGENLRTVIKEHGPMPAAAAAEIVRQVCAALTEAHRQQIVHRDIKPANIAVDQRPDGVHVKVLDFGIASLRGGTMMTFTQTGAVMGTPAYMSPEQCLGEELDGRSDIYSLGVVLFEMLCGVVPFNSPTATAVVMQHVQQTPPPLRVLNVSISPGVEAVVLHALAKRREDRYQTARELADALTAAVGGTSAAAPVTHSADAPAIVSATGAPPIGHAMGAPTMQLSSPWPIPPPRASRGDPAAASRPRGQGLGIAIGFGVAVVLAVVLFTAQRMLAPPASSTAVATKITQPDASRTVRTASAGSTVTSASTRTTGTTGAAGSTGTAGTARTTGLAVTTVPDNGAGSSSEANGGVTAMLEQTNEMRVLGSGDCGANAVFIRFKDDGSSGCAWPGAATRGVLDSGDTVVLVPVTAPGRGRIYDLLYAGEGPGARFIGILPGDGSGNLTVAVENGLLVERNGDRVKRSTLRGGRVVVVSVSEAPRTSPAAESAVRTYYALWDAQRLSEAYMLLSARYRSEHPYESWAASHQSVERITVETAPGSDPMSVAVLVRSTDRTPNGAVYGEYRGTWTAVVENGETKLDSVALVRVR